MFVVSRHWELLVDIYLPNVSSWEQLKIFDPIKTGTFLHLCMNHDTIFFKNGEILICWVQSQVAMSRVHVCIHWQRKINGSVDRQLQWWRLGVVESVTVDSDRRLSSLLRGLACVAMQQWSVVLVTVVTRWLTWPSDYTRHTCIYMPVKILVIEHTQIHTYSEFQLHSNLLSVPLCSVQARIYICICNSVYKCTQRGDSNAAEIHRIHTTVLQQSVWREGPGICFAPRLSPALLFTAAQ